MAHDPPMFAAADTADAAARGARKSRRASRPAWRGRALAASVAGLLAAVVAGCSGPGPAAPADMIESIPRDAVAVETDAFTGSVSFLWSGSPEVARVIFLHEAGSTATGWADFLLNRPEGQQYIAVDRPGFGQSDPSGAVLSLAAQAQALEPLLRDADGAPIILVGHGRGAAIALEAAARYPESVDGVVSLAAAVAPDRVSSRRFDALRTAAPLRWLLPRAGINGARERLGHADALQPLVSRLETVRQPVRIVHGARDARAPIDHAEFLRSRLPEGAVTMHRLENAGHALPWTAFRVVQAQANNLVARICGGLQQCPRGR